MLESLTETNLLLFHQIALGGFLLAIVVCFAGLIAAVHRVAPTRSAWLLLLIGTFLLAVAEYVKIKIFPVSLIGVPNMFTALLATASFVYLLGGIRRFIGYYKEVTSK